MVQKIQWERRCRTGVAKVSFFPFYVVKYLLFKVYFCLLCKIWFHFPTFNSVYLHPFTSALLHTVRSNLLAHEKPKTRRSTKLSFLFVCLFFPCRVYKKTSSNQLLTLYLGTRELVSRAGVVDPIKGIIYVDPKIIESNQKVYCQLTLTFRWEKCLDSYFSHVEFSF